VIREHPGYTPKDPERSTKIEDNSEYFVCCYYINKECKHWSNLLWQILSRSVALKTSRLKCKRWCSIVTMEWDYVSVELRPLTRPLSTPQMIHEWIWISGGMIFIGENWRTRRKIHPSATLSTTNPTWTALGANPGLCGEKPATNRLSYGTACCY
jgi:hypothetical protein